MKQNQIEHLKTGLLVFLVFLSFMFSGYLWYSTPASETIKPDDDVPPYIFKDSLYNNIEPYELICPFQVILHQSKGLSMVLPNESSNYKEMMRQLHTLDTGTFDDITPTQKNWDTHVSQVPGIQFLFLQDIPLEFIGSLFNQTTFDMRSSTTMHSVSRIHISNDPNTNRIRIWAISEKEKRVAEAYTDTTSVEWKKWITTIRPSQHIAVTATTLTRSSSGEEDNNLFFPQLHYVPIAPLPMKMLTFETENINIDNMKQWLFRDPEIKPLIPNQNESFYMYNDQLLNFNNRYNYMIFNDTSSSSEENHVSLLNQLDQIKNFMQRHQGWTGRYLLDSIWKDRLFLFRLFKQGYPVFWETGNPDHSIYPDLIQLHTGENGVDKYTRSMYYLSLKPTNQSVVTLPGKKQIIAQLMHQRIAIHSIKKIFPGYHAKEVRSDRKKQIVLVPTWVVKTSSGKTFFL